MTEAATRRTNCPHCGGRHDNIVCPFATAVEYYPDGSVKRVEFGHYAPIHSMTGEEIQGYARELAELEKSEGTRNGSV